MSSMGLGGGHTSAGRPSQGEFGEDVFLAFDKRIVRRFFGFVRPYWRQLLFVLAAVAVFVTTQVSIPILIRHAADSIVGYHGAPPLSFVLAEFLALIAINAVASFLQEWSAAILAQRVIFDLRRAMFTHLQHVSISFFDQTHVGRLMSRIQGDVNSLQEFLETSVQAVGDMFLLLGIIIILLVMDWQLALLTLSALPVMVGLRALWLPTAKEAFRKARDASSVANGALAENIGGVRTVQGALREDVNFKAFEIKVQANLWAQLRAAWLAQIMVPLVDILTGFAQAIVIGVGGYAVLSGRLDVGIMIAFIFYVQRFFDPIRTLSLQYTVMQRAMAAGYRIFEVLDVPVTIRDVPEAVDTDDLKPSIEFRRVTFGYKEGHPILHDVSFQAKPYQVVALVGPTGSGKTSIAALTHRFYDVWSGSVLIGGKDVRHLSLDLLGRTVGMVLQEPFLFTGTVIENIRYKTTEASREDVIAAAKAVCAHDFIAKLPLGYNTPLGQRGQNLSIGQRQLLSFARALVADPKILILDEATASVDSFTEQKIQNGLRTLMTGRTCLVIAHRLATVRDADMIVVLQRGHIVEQGNHDHLMAAGGLYAELYHRNHASFDDAAGGTLAEALT